MRSRLIVLLVAALGLLGAEEAVACSCVGPSPGQSIEDFYRATAKNADAVVTARLIEGPGAPNGFEPATFTFRIERTYKRRRRLEPGERLRVRAPVDSGGNCGLPDARRLRTGMFLYRYRGNWTTSACSLADPRTLELALGRATRLVASGRPSSPARGRGPRELGCPGPASPSGRGRSSRGLPSS